MSRNGPKSVMNDFHDHLAMTSATKLHSRFPSSGYSEMALAGKIVVWGWNITATG
jgi:hypothetical protein